MDMDLDKVRASVHWRIARENIRQMFATLRKHNPELALELDTVQAKVVDYIVPRDWSNGGVADVTQLDKVIFSDKVRMHPHADLPVYFTDDKDM